MPGAIFDTIRVMYEVVSVPEEKIVAAADRLFGDRPYTSRRLSGLVLRYLCTSGMVPSEISTLLKSQLDVQEIRQHERLAQLAGGRASDEYAGPEHLAQGEVLQRSRTIAVGLPVRGEEEALAARITQWHYDGDVTVAGQTFCLDTLDCAVQVDLRYPKHGAGDNSAFNRTHTIYPHGEFGVTTNFEACNDTYWANREHVPFGDMPASPAVYMMRAIEMAACHLARQDPMAG
jgi:hypothetical protein